MAESRFPLYPFLGLLMTAPLVCSSVLTGIPQTYGGSCLTTAAMSEASWEREMQGSCLVGGYRSGSDEDLLFSLETVERWRSYFIDEAQSFTREEAAIIDKEFWDLG